MGMGFAPTWLRQVSPPPPRFTWPLLPLGGNGTKFTRGWIASDGHDVGWVRKWREWAENTFDIFVPVQFVAKLTSCLQTPNCSRRGMRWKPCEEHFRTATVYWDGIQQGCKTRTKTKVTHHQHNDYYFYVATQKYHAWLNTYRRLATGNVQCVCSATYQIFFKQNFRLSISNPNPEP